MCHEPKRFYVDEPKNCIECGEPFVFTARAQKFWYETLQANFHSKAVRCLVCRRKRREGKGLKVLLAQATRAVHAKPDDPGFLLAYAEATVLHHKRFHEGDLEKAIAAAHKALKLDPHLYEALFYEAYCHEVAIRWTKADELYRRFIDLAGPVKRCRSLVNQAKKKLK